MGEKYQIKPEMIVRGPGDIGFEHAPPGLLFSLGDGSAVEATDAALEKAIGDALGYFPNVFQISAIKQSLIQQAQEARDAGQ